MALIQVNNLYKSFYGKTLFKDISFNINETDKIGLIGTNGCGKSTLIETLLGLQEGDLNPITKNVGSVIKKPTLTIGYLSQHSKLNIANTIFAELMEVFPLSLANYQAIERLNVLNDLTGPEDLHLIDAQMEDLAFHITEYEVNGGYKAEQRIKDTLFGIEIDENLWQSKIGNLSGGQKTKVSLAKVLLQEPELLILDEPTNHLDISAIEWLENFLINYKKSFLLISHDSHFLDSTVKTIFEIEGTVLKSYKGNYTNFKVQKEIFLSGALKSFELEQQKIEKLEEFVLKYKAGQKSKQARGRQKMLDNLEKQSDPIIKNNTIRLKFEIKQPSSKKILELTHLSKFFPAKKLFNNLNLSVFKGERIGIIGKNGIGKSTLLKIIVGLETPSSGKLELGENLLIGYYSQDFKELNFANSILDEIINNFYLTDEEARGMLGRLLFTKDDVFKKIGSLSGGEKARVAMLKLMLTKPNVLILDEPTNHLDIYSREILEESFSDYPGTILVVSHDRHFLDMVVDSLYIIDEKGGAKFEGNYEDYSRYKSSLEKNSGKNKSTNSKIVKSNSILDKTHSLPQTAMPDKGTPHRATIDHLKQEYKKITKSLEGLATQEFVLNERNKKAAFKNDLKDLLVIEKELKELNSKIEVLLENLSNIEKQLTLT
ncbi:ABC transporter ATP-binding protein [Candidatus Hepatincolaceae symbiont of Richtersius coronifer]